MNAEPATPRPGAWSVAAWVTAGLCAVAGIVLNVWRPLGPAPSGTPVPQELFDPGVLAAVEAYRTPRLLGGTALVALEVVVPLGLLLWPRSRAWLSRLAGRREHAPWRGALVAAAVVAATTAVSLPLAYWLGHVHRVEWGFRTGSAVGWLRDLVLATGIELVMVGAAVATFLVVVRRAGRHWPAWTALLGTGLTAVVVVVQPLVIEPLFLPTRPLQDAALQARLQEVLDRADFDAEVLVGDASLRTTNVNAYVAGLGPTRRVVVYDTLLELRDDQVAAVVAHELAHREHRDIARAVALSSAGLLAGAVALAWLLRRRPVVELVAARGTSDPRLVPVVVAAVAVMTVIALPGSNLVSRRVEAAADARALELSGDPAALIETFRTFVVRDLARPQWTGPGILLFGTHPAPATRIRAVTEQSREAGLPVPDRATLEAGERDRRHARID